MQIGNRFNYLKCVLPDICLRQLIAGKFCRCKEEIRARVVRQDLALICKINNEVHFIVFSIIDDLMQTDDIWVIQHLVNINFSHRFNVCDSIYLLHIASLQLFHHELFESIVLLAEL